MAGFFGSMINTIKKSNDNNPLNDASRYKDRPDVPTGDIKSESDYLDYQDKVDEADGLGGNPSKRSK